MRYVIYVVYCCGMLKLKFTHLSKFSKEARYVFT